jgi:hypothetical protein
MLSSLKFCRYRFCRMSAWFLLRISLMIFLDDLVVHTIRLSTVCKSYLVWNQVDMYPMNLCCVQMLRHHATELATVVPIAAIFSLLVTIIGGRQLGLHDFLTRSVASRSTTLAFAIPISTTIGGLPYSPRSWYRSMTKFVESQTFWL